MRRKNTLISEKPPDERFFKGTGLECPRSITTDCRLLRRIKGGCYGAAVGRKTKLQGSFSPGIARVRSAVRKSVILE